MTDNPNKKSLWDKIHLDPTMLLILLALLTYSALVIWSASGQDVGMMERKIGQIAMGVVIMIVMAQIPPRVYEGWAPYLYIFCIILLVAVDAFGAISKGAQRWLDLGIVRFQPSEIAKIAVPLMVARFINRDVCPPSLKNTGIALVLIFLPTLLVAAQPDLGTSILIALSGLFVLFLSGPSLPPVFSSIAFSSGKRASSALPACNPTFLPLRSAMVFSEVSPARLTK